MKGKRILFVPVALGAPSTDRWNTEFKSIFGQLGADYEVANPNFNTNNMISIINSHIAAHNVDMLILQPPDVSVLDTQIEAAKKAGIYVIVLSEFSDATGDAYVGPNLQQMAQALGQNMVTRCKAEGKNQVAIIDGYGTDAFSILTNAGWIPVFKAAGLKIVSEQEGQYDPTLSNKIAATVLQQHPDLCAFAVNLDLGAIGVGNAIQQAGDKGKVGVYTIDDGSFLCPALQSGLITETADFNLPGIGVAVGAVAQNLFELGKPAGSTRTVAFSPYTIVNGSDVHNTPGTCYTG
jgi:ribose transport system substrate-binding protein